MRQNSRRILDQLDKRLYGWWIPCNTNGSGRAVISPTSKGIQPHPNSGASWGLAGQISRCNRFIGKTYALGQFGRFAPRYAPYIYIRTIPSECLARTACAAGVVALNVARCVNNILWICYDEVQNRLDVACLRKSIATYICGCGGKQVDG